MKHQLLATDARYDRQRGLVMITLNNGAVVAFHSPLFAGLEHATPDDLRKIEVEGVAAYGLHVASLDAGHFNTGLAGRPTRLDPHAARRREGERLQGERTTGRLAEEDRGGVAKNEAGRCLYYVDDQPVRRRPACWKDHAPRGEWRGR